MKALSLKNTVNTLLTALLVVALSGVPAVNAQESNSGNKTGFEQGKHEGHANEKGKRKGFDNENNPWYDHDQDTGVVFDLVIHHHGLIPTTVFTTSVNSSMTVAALLTEILGDSTEGFQLQECYEEEGGLFMLMVTSDCTAGETTDPLNNDLTLEAAGILDDPEVHLVYNPG